MQCPAELQRGLFATEIGTMRSPETVEAVFDRIQTLTAAMRRCDALLGAVALWRSSSVQDAGPCATMLFQPLVQRLLCPCHRRHRGVCARVCMQCALLRLVRAQPVRRGVWPAGRVL
jgi:hypothetical protein